MDRPWCGNKPGRLPIMNAESVEGTVLRKSAGKIGETGPIYTLRYRVDQMLQAYDHGRGWFWSSTDGAGGEAMKHVHCSAGVNVADAEVNFHNVTFGTSLAPIKENLPLHWRILSGGFGGCLREFKIASLIAEAEEPITSEPTRSASRASAMRTPGISTPPPRLAAGGIATVRNATRRRRRRGGGGGQARRRPAARPSAAAAAVDAAAAVRMQTPRSEEEEWPGRAPPSPRRSPTIPMRPTRTSRPPSGRAVSRHLA